MANSADVANERAIEREYGKLITAKVAQRPVAHTPQGGRRSSGKTPDLGYGQLLGRVALDGPNELIDDRPDFYISDKYLSAPGLAVYSWSAPIACTYFRGTNHHELCEEVVAVRTYERNRGEIVDFSDEVLDARHTAPFSRRGLSVSRAPVQVPLPRRSAATQDPAHSDQLLTPVLVSPPATIRQVREPTYEAPALRAEAALTRRLEAPRTSSLSPVLATLQPDQYELTTSPGSQPLIIEGKPGTGKTVVAIHRAAYLISPDSQAVRARHVLLVGPTDQYVRHVAAIRDQLVGDSDRLEVRSMPGLLKELVHPDNSRLRGGIAYSWQDVDRRLAVMAHEAASRIRATRVAGNDSQKAVMLAYELLRSNGSPQRPVTHESEWSAYLGRLPTYETALSRRSTQPLLAMICWILDRPVTMRKYTHIVVDEAQDVLPLEWALLDEMNAGDEWTILGDLNQRRSDFALHSWSHVADELGILDDSGQPPIRSMEIGYRSTKQIIQFANQLLPKSDRLLTSLQQNGDEPTVEPALQRDLVARTVASAEIALDAHEGGTVAVIAIAPDDVRVALRKKGWISPQSVKTLTREGRTLSVLHPDDARGLEFDAVVVVEPSSFTPNVGRHGQLYTALTRANRSLYVVHSSPLPDELRRRRR